jgi:hypothetical protein
MAFASGDKGVILRGRHAPSANGAATPCAGFADDIAIATQASAANLLFQSCRRRRPFKEIAAGRVAPVP